MHLTDAETIAICAMILCVGYLIGRAIDNEK